MYLVIVINCFRTVQDVLAQEARSSEEEDSNSYSITDDWIEDNWVDILINGRCINGPMYLMFNLFVIPILSNDIICRTKKDKLYFNY